MTNGKRLSIYTSLNVKASIEERIAAIAEAGFDAVCLDFEKELEPTETSWENQLALCEKYALPVEAVHLTGENMNAVWSEGEAGERVIGRLIDETARMASLGLTCPGVCHVTWGHDVPHAPDETGLARFLRAADAAEKVGVTIALENSVFPEYLQFILERVDSKRIGFCYDSGHENAFSPSYDYLSRFGSRLAAVHLHDNHGTMDEHAIPFTGTVDWSKKVGQLKQTELWRKAVSLESTVPPSMTLSEGLRKSWEAADRLAGL